MKSFAAVICSESELVGDNRGSEAVVETFSEVGGRKFDKDGNCEGETLFHIDLHITEEVGRFPLSHRHITWSTGVGEQNWSCS